MQAAAVAPEPRKRSKGNPTILPEPVQHLSLYSDAASPALALPAPPALDVVLTADTTDCSEADLIRASEEAAFRETHADRAEKARARH